MKSNSEPASMRTPSSVDIAPSITGANMCSNATTERRFLFPIAVRKPWSGVGGLVSECLWNITQLIDQEHIAIKYIAKIL